MCLLGEGLGINTWGRQTDGGMPGWAEGEAELQSRPNNKLKVESPTELS